MARQDGQNSQMEKDATDNQLLTTQKLAGFCAPRIRIAVKAQQAAEQESRNRNIRENLKEEEV